MELLTTVEAAKYLRMNREVLRRKTKAVQVPAIRMGGRWKYPREALDDWLSRGCPSFEESPSLFPQRLQQGRE